MFSVCSPSKTGAIHTTRYVRFVESLRQASLTHSTSSAISSRRTSLDLSAAPKPSPKHHRKTVRPPPKLAGDGSDCELNRTPKSILKGTRSSQLCRTLLTIVIVLALTVLASDILAYRSDSWSTITTCVRYGMRHRNLQLTPECVDELQLTANDIEIESYKKLAERFCGRNDKTLECNTFGQLTIEGFVILFMLLSEIFAIGVILVLCILVTMFVTVRKYLTLTNLSHSCTSIKLAGILMSAVLLADVVKTLVWSLYSQPLIMNFEAQERDLHTGINYSYSFYLTIVSAVFSFINVVLLKVVHVELTPGQFLCGWFFTVPPAIDGGDIHSFESGDFT